MIQCNHGPLHSVPKHLKPVKQKCKDLCCNATCHHLTIPCLMLEAVMSALTTAGSMLTDTWVPWIPITLHGNSIPG